MAIAEVDLRRVALFEPTRLPQEVEVGSLGDARLIHEAGRIVEGGGIVAAQVYGVFGMWGDGTNPDTFKAMARIKRIFDDTKPYSTMMFSQDLAPFIDTTKLHPSLSNLLSEPNDLSAAIGAMVHLRLPLKSDVVDRVPGRMRSFQDGKWVIHNLDPSGHPIAKFINELNDREIYFAAVTTLNEHGQPENTTLEEARETLAKADPSAIRIPLILTDPTYKTYEGADHQVKGSLIVVDAMSARVIRPGFIPEELASLLLQVQLVNEGPKEGHFSVDVQLYKLVQVAQTQGYTPELLRLLIHNLIKGVTRVG